MEEEIWRPVVGYEGLYEISSLGRLKSLYRVITKSNGQKMIVHTRFFVGNKNNSGYLNFTLCGARGNKCIGMHCLVANAFVDKPVIDEELEVNHIDGNKTNNVASNLEWLSVSENKKHAFAVGLIKDNTKLSSTLLCRIVNLRSKGLQYQDIEKELGLGRRYLNQIFTGRRNRSVLTRLGYTIDKVNGKYVIRPMTEAEQMNGANATAEQ